MGSGHVFAMQAETVYYSISTGSTYEIDRYSYADGVLTLKDTPSSISLTFTLDYDKFDALTVNTDLLYADTATDNSEDWGLRATANATVTGKWTSGDTGEYETNATVMSAADLATYATGTGENRVIEGLQATIASGSVGTKLLASDGQEVFVCSGLTQDNKTFSSAVINTDLITEIVVDDAYTDRLRYVNSSGTWEKIFNNEEVTNVTSSYSPLTGGDSGTVATNTNPLVVGGAGQLHLEA